MEPCVYYVIQVRIAGTHKNYREFMAHRERYYMPYGGRAIPSKWYRTDNLSEAHQFETPGKARSIAKRINAVKEVLRHGGAWEVLRITKEVVEASDESPLLKLAKVAK